MRASDSSAFEDTPADGLIGRRFGRYVLCRELGVGGMARVHLARSEGEAGFAKLVALKSIHPHLASEQTFVDMFLDEARIASRIEPPRTSAAVFDFGRAEGTYFLAMEYLVGEPLSRVIEAVRRAAPGRPSSSELPSVRGAHRRGRCRGAARGARARGRERRAARRRAPRRVASEPLRHLRRHDEGRRLRHAQARAARLPRPTPGSLKGKFAYMAPEQMQQAASIGAPTSGRSACACGSS